METPQIHTPAPPGSISAAIREATRRWPERPCLQMPGGNSLRRLTYAEVEEAVERAREHLRALNLHPGDRVALLSENSPEWIVACLAALELDTTVVPLDTALSPEDLKGLIDRASPRAFLMSPGQFERLSPVLGPGAPCLNLEAGCTPFSTGYAPPERTSPEMPRGPVPALIIFTSGTTGQSKGVLLSHRGLLHTARSCITAIALDRDADAERPRALCVLPLHHVTGFTVNFLATFLTGASLTFVEALNAESILSAMQQSRATVLPAVPRLFELFYEEIQRKVAARGKTAKWIFSGLGACTEWARNRTPWNPGPALFKTVHAAFGGHLRICCTGAAPMSVEVQKGLERLGFTVLEAYGLTESSGIATLNRLDRRRLGTVGPPIEGVRVRIANAQAATGEGEVCISGPILMDGYLDDPEATGETVRDGWLHTGDLGRVDADGFLAITGRIKELIITPGGKNISPPDVERRYAGLPGVKELAVFGVPVREGYGERIHAAVVPDPAGLALLPPGPSTRERLEAAVNQRAADVPSHMRIQRIHLVDELPKTTTLKVRRMELNTEEAPSSAGPTRRLSGGPADETTRRVLDIVRGLTRETGPDRSVTPETSLQFELGIDSLGLIELAARIETAFGIRLDERRLPVLHTVADLSRAVSAARETPTGESSPADLLAGGRSEPVPHPRGPAARAFLAAFGGLTRLLYNYRVLGLENLPDTGPFILCPNHESHFDIFWVSARLPFPFRRDLCCFGKREHFEAAGTRTFAKLARAIPTDRDGDILPALRAGIEALRQNRPLLIHPEGARTRTGEPGPFRRGAARLALAARAPLIPVAIAGAYGIFPSHRLLPRLFDWKRFKRRRLTIVFGPPIFPETFAPTPGQEEQLTRKLREAVVALSAGSGLRTT